VAISLLTLSRHHNTESRQTDPTEHLLKEKTFTEKCMLFSCCQIHFIELDRVKTAFPNVEKLLNDEKGTWCMHYYVSIVRYFVVHVPNQVYFYTVVRCNSDVQQILAGSDLCSTIFNGLDNEKRKK
jgi:hypothetical protein